MSSLPNRRVVFQRLSTLAVALGAARVLPARAQAYPSRAITLVVPYTPGGTTDNRSGPTKLNSGIGGNSADFELLGAKPGTKEFSP